MEHVPREPKAPSQSPAPRQLGFTIPDRVNNNPEVEVTEVAFLNQALEEAISQGASYVHIEPADDGVVVRYRVNGEYREFVREARDGGQSKASEAEVSIVGGHTVDDPEPKYGLAVTGLIRPGEQVTNDGARPGDALVLTKAIGTGIITTAGKAGIADEVVLAEAIDSMSALNRGASEAMLEVGVHSATDVTGFGLLGHLHSIKRLEGKATGTSR